MTAPPRAFASAWSVLRETKSAVITTGFLELADAWADRGQSPRIWSSECSPFVSETHSASPRIFSTAAAPAAIL
eukprot:CAMPEP_0174911484 /NCGR_PEP_ID=MMETSP0167-20121228/76847_1 /TAXON_ID=38298 /ORGANISM="Rhodella maculata, Strain CCMP736" /LENGTH=73 /DNA_ID=CAMNT_0016155993 /DNA_START=32 /DNA_END=249 /DNA_ORIENTATION=-